MSKLKLVIDTNVWVKGMVFGSTNPYCRKIMEWVRSDHFTLIFAQDTIGETMYMLKEMCNWNRNLSISEKIKNLQALTKHFYYGTSVNTKYTTAPKCKDPDDDMFVKCAIESEADYIIMDDIKSGMADIKEIKALFPKDFVDLYFNTLKQIAVGE